MISASMVKELREITSAGMLDCKKALEATNGNMEEAITWLREKGIAKAAKKASRIASEGLAFAKENDNIAAIVEVNSETDFVAKNEEFISLVNDICDAILDNDVETMEEALKLIINGKTIAEEIVAKTSTIGEKLSFRRFERLVKDSEEEFGIYSHMGGKIVSLSVIKGNDKELAKDISMQIAAMRPSYLSLEDVPLEAVNKEKEILKEQIENDGKIDSSKIDMVINGRINKFYEEVCLNNQLFIKENKVKVSKYVESKGSQILKFIRYEVGEGMEKKEENFADEVMKQINN